MTERTAQQELYFACDQVMRASRGGDGNRTASKEEVVIPIKVFGMVLAALKKANEAGLSDSAG